MRIPANTHVEPPPPANTLVPLASTYKFRTYVPSSSASLDLIQRTGKDEPSFRISSRYLASPIDPGTQLLRPPLYDDNYRKTVEDSELVYTNRETVIWPPPDASPLLRERKFFDLFRNSFFSPRFPLTVQSLHADPFIHSPST